jgi:acyl carrier protein
MDSFGKLPLTLEALFERLESGQIFTVHGNDGLDYTLFLDKEGHIVLKQGNQDQPFRQMEIAVLTLLNCVGEFSSPSASLVSSTDDQEVDIRIARIIGEVFHIDPYLLVPKILLDDLDVEGLGLDLLDVVVRLEKEFGITIRDEDVFMYMKTIGGIQHYLKQREVL